MLFKFKTKQNYLILLFFICLGITPKYEKIKSPKFDFVENNLILSVIAK